MTPRKVGGIYWIDTTVEGRRVQISTEARTLKDYRRALTILDRLRRHGAREILAALTATPRQLRMRDLFAADRRGELLEVLDARPQRAALWPAVDAWVLVSARAPASRTRYATNWRTIKALTQLPEYATVADLAAVPWRDLYVAWAKSPAGWNHLRRAISAFLSAAVGSGVFRDRILAAIPEASEKPRQRFVSVVELGAILEHVQPKLRPVYLTMAATGAGPREFLTLTDMHFVGEVLRIPGTKEGRPEHRLVPVPESLISTVRAAVRLAPYLTYETLYRRFKDAATAAKIGDVRPYDLRHCFGTWLRSAGVDLDTIRKVMGHQRINQTSDYVLAAPIAGVAEAMATILEPITRKSVA